MIILDTNVLSELMRPATDPHVLSWLHRVEEKELATTAITVAEIEYGLARLPGGSRANVLRPLRHQWVLRVILPVRCPRGAYGQLMSERERAGRPTSGFDAQIAAIEG